MIRVTGLGPLPAGDPLTGQLAIADALTAGPAGQGIGLPFEVQTAGEGEDESSAILARACAQLDQIFTERGTHGWKLTERPGRDLRAARLRVTEGLDALAIALSGYAGPLAISSLGPVTLAARLYLARGDRVLADPGAVREVAHSLAAGLAEHVRALRRAAPGLTDITVQLDEPLLGAAVAGVLPNFSGMYRIRPLAAPIADEALRAVIAEVASPVVVHLGEALGGLDWVRRAPVAGVGISLGRPTLGPDFERRWHAIAETVEAGTPIWWGMPEPPSSQCAGPGIGSLADQLWRPWRQVGLEPGLLDCCVLFDRATPRPATLDQVRARVGALVRVAGELIERAEG